MADVVSELRRQNELLREQLHNQSSAIESLSRKVASLEEKSSTSETTPAPASAKGFGDALAGKVRFSGEGAVGFFDTGPMGAFPNSEFRVDEAKLFVEAPVGGDVYFFSELNLTLRESTDRFFEAGELYLDFENVSQLWNRDGQLNLRAGRFDIPFGEEYQTRDAILNPLISHSLSDIWGVDEGVEIYGKLGRVQYVLAVQNGGHPSLHDFTADKAVVGRIGMDPARWLHLSVSAMRTGNSDAVSYEMTELWFGNGFIRALGPMATTSLSHAELIEGDVRAHWARGHIAAAGGYIRFDDNDPAANNRRDVYYYYVEGVQSLNGKFHLAARWSQILAAGGFPIVGYGDFGKIFMSNNELTSNLRRFSVGLGYKWSEQLCLKLEYGRERGEKASGAGRSEDFLAAELAFKF